MGIFKVTFETLPTAVEQLFSKLDRIERKLNQPQPVQAPVKDAMLIDETIDYLLEYGIKYKKSTIYKKSCLGEMPGNKRAGRLTFSRKDLKSWVEQGMPNIRELQAIDHLAKGAKKR